MQTKFKVGQRVRIEYRDYKGKLIRYYAEVLTAGIQSHISNCFPILDDLSQAENYHVKPGEEYYYAPRTKQAGGVWLSVNALHELKRNPK